MFTLVSENSEWYMQSNRIFGLDVLRALAISLVVLSHCTYLLFPNSETAMLTIIRIMGAVGVDLFFVLSGFLIGGILLKLITQHKTSFKDLFLFWKRRWLRTLPNYFLILFVNVALLLLLGTQLPEHLGLYVPFLQNVINPHPDFFTEAWSLSVEEYAYLLLPICLFVVFKLLGTIDKEKLFLWVVLLLIIGLFGLKTHYYFNTDVTTYKGWSSSFRKVVIYRLDSIYIGFLLIYLVKKIPEKLFTYKRQLFFLGLLLFGLLHVLIFVFNLKPQNSLGFYVFIYLTGVIISLGMLFPYFIKLNYKGLFFKPVEFVSKLSYAIYLVNYSIVLLTIQYFFDINAMSIIQKGLLLLLFLGSTLVLSVLLYIYFEKPILNFRERKYSSQ